MKKTYMSPETTVVKVLAQKMMASSPLGGGIKDADASSEYDVLTKKDNGWDIWGSDEADYDDNDY